MKSAARPRNDTTKLRALATGLQFMTTAAPKINVSKAKIQNRNGDIGYWSSGAMNSCPRAAPHYSNTPLTRYCSFLLVPFQYDAMHHSTDLEQLFLVMHHVGSRKTGDRVVLAQKNRLLGANFFAHSAKNAADHVDIERLRVLLDFGEP